MNSLIRKFTTGAVVAGILTSSVFAASPAGYVDFGHFEAEVGEQYVEVDINKSLLKLAAVFAKHEDPEIAKLIGSLERVRVNVIGMNDDNRAEATGHIESIRADLDQAGWARVVSVREKAGDNVVVFLRQNGDESIQGVVVSVIGQDGEAVLVNIVGDVQLEQIARIGARLDIEPLRKLNLTPADTES